MSGNDERSSYHHGQGWHGHGHGYGYGVKPFMVHQIVGTGETQKSLDIHIRVPKPKPAIEQVVDVFIKRLQITCVNVLTDKVVVRGDFEAKALYVSCLPSQPVHAVSARCVRFTADVCIPGVRCGMDADATAVVEYVDYDCDKRTRAYWHKNNQDSCEPEYCCEKLNCTRKIDISVVLGICVKVFACREIVVCPPPVETICTTLPAASIYPGLPIYPKG